MSFRTGPGQDFEQYVEVSDDDGQSWRILRSLRHFRSAVATPGNLRAMKIKKKKVILEWNDTSAAEARFEVLRKEGEDWVPVETLEAGATTTTIKALRRRTAYTFGVRACNDSECSEPAEITVTTK
jgi:hypothetical protein